LKHPSVIAALLPETTGNLSTGFPEDFQRKLWFCWIVHIFHGEQSSKSFFIVQIAVKCNDCLEGSPDEI